MKRALLISGGLFSVAVAGLAVTPAVASARYGSPAGQNTNGQNGAVARTNQADTAGAQLRARDRDRIQDPAPAQLQTHDQTRDRQQLHECRD